MLFDSKILKNEIMAATGSQILRVIQNNDLPKLDLLVREVIQNSLDAKNDIDKYVGIKVNTGNFNYDAFNTCLGEMGKKIADSYNMEVYNSFISFTDYNTTGLTGPLIMSNINNNNDYGKYLNLVFNIGRAQANTQAGGSWGYGKTVFYRIGIGLVIFYSRIFEDNEYKSRLAVSFVQNDKNTIIPSANPENPNLKTGIMWFGRKKDNSDNIYPIEDENDINSVLDYFNIEPYKDNKTGTTILMPYINKEEILEDTYMDDDNRASWTYDIADYIKVAIQRWYAPRLMNKYYTYNPYMELYINNVAFDEYTDFLPLFKLIRDLYNISQKEDFENKDNIYKLSINIRNTFELIDEAGKIVFTKISKKDLNMIPPNNQPSPYVQVFNDRKEEIEPIITFCRKPGMLLKYDFGDTWAKRIKLDPSGDSYIIGIFVANSNNKLKNNNKTFEEHLRNCEKADHTNWTEQNNYNILKSIQNNIQSKINKAFEETENENAKGVNSKLTRILTQIFLPKTGLGYRPNALKPKEKGEVNLKGAPITRTTISFLDNTEKRDFIEKTISKDFELKTIKNTKVGFQFNILSEISNITLDEWKEQFNNDVPIEIVRLQLLEKSFDDDVEYMKNISLNNAENDYEDNDIIVQKIFTKDKKNWIGWKIFINSQSETKKIRCRLTYICNDINLSYEIVKVREELLNE